MTIALVSNGAMRRSECQLVSENPGSLRKMQSWRVGGGRMERSACSGGRGGREAERGEGSEGQGAGRDLLEEKEGVSWSDDGGAQQGRTGLGPREGGIGGGGVTL